MKFKQTIQIGDNMSDIFKLPCIAGVFKNTDNSVIYRLELFVKSKRGVAVKSDWLCEDYEGNWHCITDHDKRNNEEVFTD